MPETIAATTGHYIALAAKLAVELATPSLATRRREAIREAAGRADGDTRVVRAFEDYVAQALAQSATT